MQAREGGRLRVSEPNAASDEAELSCKPAYLCVGSRRADYRLLVQRTPVKKVINQGMA